MSPRPKPDASPNDATPTIRLHRTVVRTLPCVLTEEELLKKGQELAEAVEDIQTEERRQGDIKASMKARLTALGARRDEISIAVRRKEEDRDVEVDIFHDYARGIVEDIRRDTGERIAFRPMSEDERQRELPMEPANA